MPGMTTYLKDAFLAHAFTAAGGGAFTRPNPVYLAYLTADPTDAGTQTSEVSPAGSRELITFGTPSSRNTNNTNVINADTTGWTDTSDITHWAIADTDGSTAGNYLWTGIFNEQPIAFTAGATIQTPAGGINLDFDPLTPGVGTFQLSDVAAELWLRHVFNVAGAPWTAPTTVTTALYDGNPGQNGGTNEFAGGSYVRQNFGALAAIDDSGSYRRTRNAAGISFSSVADVQLTNWGIFADTQFVANRQQTPLAVTPGSDIDAAINALELLAD